MAWRRLRAPQAEMSCHFPSNNSERTCPATVRCLLHKRLYHPHHQHQTVKSVNHFSQEPPAQRHRRQLMRKEAMGRGAMGSEVQELQGGD